MAIVKVGMIGKSVQEIELSDDCKTAGAVLKKAGMNAPEEQIRVNGKSAKNSQKLDDGDIVLIIPKVKGAKYF